MGNRPDQSVAVIGVGCTPFRVHSDQPFIELVHEAVSTALKDAQLEIGEIDTVVDAGVDLLDGKGLSNTELLAGAGCYLKEEVKLEEDGATAAYYAWLRLKSGLHRTALVFGYSKSTALSIEDYSAVMLDPIRHRPLGITDTNILALQAQAYSSKYNVTPRDCDALLSDLWARARDNPLLANMPAPEKSTETISSPLRRRDLPVDADGAVALILATHEGVRGGQRPVWIRGAGLSVDAYDIGERALTGLASLRSAARRAYKQTGVRKPAREIARVEISEPTPYHAMMICEALGLADQGKGSRVLRNGTGRGKTARVNGAGGMLSARCLVAAGLWRIAESIRHVRQQGGAALAHGTSGLGMQSNTVFVLS